MTRDRSSESGRKEKHPGPSGVRESHQGGTADFFVRAGRSPCIPHRRRPGRRDRRRAMALASHRRVSVGRRDGPQGAKLR